MFNILIFRLKKQRFVTYHVICFIISLTGGAVGNGPTTNLRNLFYVVNLILKLPICKPIYITHTKCIYVSCSRCSFNHLLSNDLRNLCQKIHNKSAEQEKIHKTSYLPYSHPNINSTTFQCSRKKNLLYSHSNGKAHPQSQTFSRPAATHRMWSRTHVVLNTHTLLYSKTRTVDKYFRKKKKKNQNQASSIKINKTKRRFVYLERASIVYISSKSIWRP